AGRNEPGDPDGGHRGRCARVDRKDDVPELEDEHERRPADPEGAEEVALAIGPAEEPPRELADADQRDAGDDPRAEHEQLRVRHDRPSRGEVTSGWSRRGLMAARVVAR